MKGYLFLTFQNATVEVTASFKYLRQETFATLTFMRNLRKCIAREIKSVSSIRYSDLKWSDKCSYD